MGKSGPAPLQPGGGIGKPFTPWPVAQTSQRVNGSGLLARSAPGRGAQTITTSIGAGQTTQFPAAGQRFYLRAASAPLQIRAKGDAFDTYTPGTGNSADPGNLFDLIEVQNTSPYPISFSLWVGFGNFIDHRLILETGVIFPVVFPTWPTPNVAALLQIPDLTGQAFQDINGGSWVALSRVALNISNVDLATTATIQEYGSPVVGTGILAVFPQTSISLPIAGNYSLRIGSGNVNCIVSEIYNALASTT